MNIYIEGKRQGIENQIIVGYEDAPFLDFLTEDAEHLLIESRIKNKKPFTILQKAEYSIIIQVLKNDQKEAHMKLEDARLAAHEIYQHLKDLETETLILVNAGIKDEEILAFSEGLYLSNYKFNKYFTKKEKQFDIKNLGIISQGITAEEILQLEAVLEGNTFCRNLVNEPLSYLTATKLAKEISAKGKEVNITVEIFNKKKIETLRMGGLLAVNKGSTDPPTFSVMEYKPENHVNKKPYILVGKGVVYDTGGLSLKPTLDSMDYMKSDMGGAAAVAGAIYAIARSKMPVHIVGLIPATDNRPDGNAYVPGDVIEMHNGSTVEVLNTDAEGRMILADALSYARQYDPELVIELSTLTGAAQAAVGKYAIVGMGNAERVEMNQLIEAGFKSFERIAEFPFWDDFAELLTSDIADQKNIGGRYAGAITAGKFLEKFTDYPFIHLDIAGPSFNKTADKYRGKGGSGIGVRLLFEFFKQKIS